MYVCVCVYVCMCVCVCVCLCVCMYMYVCVYVCMYVYVYVCVYMYVCMYTVESQWLEHARVEHTALLKPKVKSRVFCSANPLWVEQPQGQLQPFT